MDKRRTFPISYHNLWYSDTSNYLPINVFDLAGYIPNLFEHEPLHIFSVIDIILSEKQENDWNNPMFYADPHTAKPWVEYYRQSPINGELLTVDDIVFKDHWKEYHS